MKMMRHYLFQNLVAVDQLINTLLGGWADETLSARCHRTQSRLEPWIDLLFFWQDSHCKQAWQWEMERGDLPMEYRDSTTKRG